MRLHLCRYFRWGANCRNQLLRIIFLHSLLYNKYTTCKDRTRVYLRLEYVASNSSPEYKPLVEYSWKIHVLVTDGTHFIHTLIIGGKNYKIWIHAPTIWNSTLLSYHYFPLNCLVYIWFLLLYLPFRGAKSLRSLRQIHWKYVFMCVCTATYRRLRPKSAFAPLRGVSTV